MEQRISLLTLGCRDIAGQAAFYDAMGWARVPNDEGIIVFDLLSQTLGLYPLQDLVKDIGVDMGTLGHGAMTFGYNTRSRAEVDDTIARVEQAGGKVLKPAQEVFWGGYHGYFADPEGHIWEVAHNPFAPLNADGAFRWNGYEEEG